MRQKSVHPESPSERIVKNIRRATRKQYSAEEKIRIVLDGLRGESSIAELCRREGIAEGLYYRWSKEFLEAGKRRLAGGTGRALGGAEERTAASPPVPRRQAALASKHERSTMRREERIQLPRALLRRLQQLELVQWDGHSWQLTGVGRQRYESLV